MTHPAAHNVPSRAFQPRQIDLAARVARHHAAVIASEVRRLARELTRTRPSRAVSAPEREAPAGS